AGQNSSDLDYVSTTALALNGGTIKDAGGSHPDADLTLAAPGAAHSLGSNKNIVVDTTPPTVSSINRVGSTPTNAASVQWTVTFSESVTGVDTGDFTLAASGVSGSITGVTGSGTTYTVTAGTGTGSGTLGLNLVDNDTIVDAAGNKLGGTGIGNGNFTGQVFTIDKTAPTISGAATTSPNAAGWYDGGSVTVHFTCADALSGIASCPPDVTLSAEGANQSVTGTATDNAGNSASATVSGINIDKTGPAISGSRSPAANANGWNNSDVTASFLCSDVLSGIASCTSPITLSAAGAAQSATGTATDKAGNSTSTTVSGINIDKTAPTISGAARTSPNAAGWYDGGSVTVHFTCADALSGIASCPPDVTLSAEGANQSVTGTATDNAGNSASATVSGINIDKTGPAISGSRSPAANANGWNNSDVTASFLCSD